MNRAPSIKCTWFRSCIPLHRELRPGLFAPPREDIEPAARSWTRYGGGIRELTVKGLNAECKLPGLRKYSIPNKAELTSLLEGKCAIIRHVCSSVYVWVFTIRVNRRLLQDSKTVCIEKGRLAFPPVCGRLLQLSRYATPLTREVTFSPCACNRLHSVEYVPENG